MKKFAVFVMTLGFVFALSLPTIAADYDNVDLPQIPVLIPLLAGHIEIGKFAISPVSQVVDQAINGYRGYPLSLITEGVNAHLNLATDIYQTISPIEWARNKDLYAPVQASVYNGGMIDAMEFK